MFKVLETLDTEKKGQLVNSPEPTDFVNLHLNQQVPFTHNWNQNLLQFSIK